MFASEPLSAARQSELLQESLASFDQAVAAARKSPDRAEQLFRQAAGDLEALIAAGVHNESLEFNLGNCYVRLNDLGRAILHYRRAQIFAPGDVRVAANLDFARQRVEPRIHATGETQLLDRLLVWNRSLSRNGRFWIATLASAGGWALLLIWLRWRQKPLIWCGAALVLVGLANAATVYIEIRRATETPPAVVIKPNTMLRRGRGEGYEPVLREALGAGVEATIRDRRGDWCEIRLDSGVSGWIPAANLAVVEIE